MRKEDIKIGLQVTTNRDWPGVPEGSKGIIIEDYGSGITIGWDLPGRPYPHNLQPQEVAEMFAIDPLCPLRDGFDKETELQFLNTNYDA